MNNEMVNVIDYPKGESPVRQEDVIDIILVSYNRPHFLKIVIPAIKERTAYPHRLIVVDSGSNKETTNVLNRYGKTGMIDKLILIKENIGQASCQNEGLRHVKSKYVITTQDDLIPPQLIPCWLERLKHLMEKHEDYGSICLRIERTRRVDWDETEDIIRNYKSMPSVFRIHRTAEMRSLGENPFGNRKHWESPVCANSMKLLKKKFGMATHIYCSHRLGFMSDNKGYVGDFSDYFTYSPERVKQGEDKPYPDIDPKTLIPIKINHGVDRPEHDKRLVYWGITTGIQSEGQTNKEWREEQRQEIAKYCEEGKLNLDLGCGKKKCSEFARGVDTYPYESVDIVNDVNDLWMFKGESVDNIVSSHLLEHVADVKRAVSEWTAILKKGGRFVFIVPDAEKKPETICEPSHKSAFTKAVIRKLMGEVFNYDIERLEEFGNKSLIFVGIKK